MILKYFATLFFFLLISFSIYSQEISDSLNKKFTFECNITSLPDISLSFGNGLYYDGQIMARKSKFSIGLGYVGWLYNNKQGAVFNGGMLSGRYYPLKISKLLNFYFMIDIYYFHQTNGYNSTMEYLTNIYYDMNYSSTSQTLRCQAGYGFTLKIYKGLFLSQALGVGTDFKGYNNSTIVTGHPELNTSYSGGNVFLNSENSATIKIGLEYHFN